jgi:RNA polymerase sigma factor (TIGR02999 family)
MSEPGEITQLLIQLREGKKETEEQIYALVYDELRRLARRQLRLEKPEHSFQPSDLVHNAYLKLIRQRTPNWQNRAHFLAIAARVMRRILMDHARAKRAGRGPGAVPAVPIEAAKVYFYRDPDEFLAIDRALSRLAEEYPRQSKVVEMRFFGGLSEEEISEVLGITVRTVKRDWRYARAWLYTELSKGLHDAAGTPARLV